MPEEIERPAGQPSAATWTAWVTYIDRRRERAELAGLFFQGERDALRHAYELVAEQLAQCVAWSKQESEQ